MVLSAYARARLKEIVFATVLTAAFILVSVFASPAHARSRHRHHHAHHIAPVIDASGNDTQIIGGRPSGCPYQFCGCGLRKYLGINDARLNLAWNWARLFPRTQARPGAAAVRHHHVMLLVSQVSGSIWTVRDYNGGKHLAWIHDRDVRGYVFVIPGNQLTER